MPKPSFVHLHNHTQYSLLDGASKIEELVERAARFEMPAVAITDHGNLFGAIPFFEAAAERGIQPILGCEMYVAPGARTDRTPPGPGRKPYHHLLLLARDDEGYRNLMRLSTAGFLEGYYYRPRIDRDLLQRHACGLIATSTCLGGEIPQLILAGRREEAERVACEYREVFGPENFYFEIQDQGIPEEKALNEVLVPMGRRLRIPLLATNDCHFLSGEDHFAHDILICIQTGKTVKDADRMRFTREHYFKSPEEMWKAFASLPEAAANTLEVAARCRVALPKGGHLLPHFQVPGDLTAEGYFRDVTERGFEERLPSWVMLERKGLLRVPIAEYRRRLESEIDMIVRMGFAGYFLIVWDFIKYARDHGIPVGPGRGSAAGSLVAYCLRITDVDPLQYDLLFERFLNPERITLPDIDIDFCMRGRGQVIDYVRDKYGRENVAQIITFATLGAKAVIRDAGRGLDVPYRDCDRIAKMIPAEPDMTIDKAIQQVPGLRQMYEKEDKVRQLLDVSKRLEGLTRHASVHAAGVVISPRPIVEYSPLARTRDDEIVTQYAMDEIGRIGLLKMDFLGLKTLTLISDCVARLRDEGIEVDVEGLALDDEQTYACFSAARTDGVFQFESSGMKDILRKLKPDRFEDLIALNALFRPGPIGSGMIDDYIERRHGRRRIEYIVPQLEEILGVTYGVIVYQEQVMQIASRLAGFSLGEADILRRAMGKKKKDVMAAQREAFVKGCRARGVGERDAKRIFDLMEHFAGYGFNKAHSTAYALIAYRTAWLKAHYPRHFMASLLTMEKDNTDNIVKYIGECREIGIAVLAPHVNGSGVDFTVETEGLRFGLSAVKNVGAGAARTIVEARERHGPFSSLQDLCGQIDPRTANKRVLESLIKAGALDGLGPNRATLCASLDAALEAGQQALRDKESGQAGLFGGDGAPATGPLRARPLPEWPEKELLACEKETLGFYMAGHPFREYAGRLSGLVTHTTSRLKEVARPRKVTLAGIVSALKRRKTKRGDLMAVFHLEDLEGSVEVIAFPEVYAKHRSLLSDDAALLVAGNVEVAEDQRRVIAETFLPLERAEEKAREVVLAIPPGGLAASEVERVRDLLKERPGPCPVYLEVTEPRGFRATVQAGQSLKVSPSRDLTLALEDLLGKGAVRFR